ncbi:MAG: hypothetical protein K2Q22_15085 [Cytophagales bacterium]|nr:hypothetical protein [Cytophagales bacterium]
MPSVVIKYKSAKTLQALLDFAKYLNYVVVETPKNKAAKARKNSLPITFAENPDIRSLAGIWKDYDISIEDIRKNSWRDAI